jgi:hypothetical protein
MRIFSKFLLVRCMKRLKTSSRGLEWRFRKKIDKAPQNNWFRKSSALRLQRWSWRCWLWSNNFFSSNEIHNLKRKFFMVSFEAFNLLIQESYDAMREDMINVTKHPGLILNSQAPPRSSTGRIRSKQEHPLRCKVYALRAGVQFARGIWRPPDPGWGGLGIRPGSQKK